MSKEFNKTELRQNEDRRTETRNDECSTGTSSTTCARARVRAREIVHVEERMELRELYREAVGYEMQPFVERMVIDYLTRGMELPVVLHAIELTGWAPRPSAHYLRAILRRYEDNDIWTEPDVERDEWRRSREREIYAAHVEADRREAAFRDGI